MHTRSITRNHRGDIKKTKETLQKTQKKEKNNQKNPKAYHP